MVTIEAFAKDSKSIIFFLMSISVLSLNVMDIRNTLKRKCSLSFCQNKGADFYFRQETHGSEADGEINVENKGNTWASCGRKREVAI